MPGVETRQHSQAFFNCYLEIGLAVQFRKCHSIYLPFDRCSDILDLCEEQVKNKRCLGWKHGNTPRHFLIGMQKKFLADALEFLRESPTKLEIQVQINRLSQQIQFIIEIDQLKQVIRQTLLTDGSRWENSAEHSWHLAVTTECTTLTNKID